MCSCTEEAVKNGTCSCFVDKVGPIAVQDPALDIVFFTVIIVVIIAIVRLARRGVFRDSMSTKKLVKKDVYDEDLDGV
jgi:hypothetical protein